MTIAELKQSCEQGVATTGLVQLVSPNRSAPFPRKGWPKGELLCINSEGKSVWLYKADALLAAMKKNAAVLGATI